MQDSLLNEIKRIKKRYLEEGIEIVGIFGSMARGDADRYSDIDITYKLNNGLFFSKYKDGFSQILKIQEVKESLEKALRKKVDFISLSASRPMLKEQIERDLIYV